VTHLVGCPWVERVRPDGRAIDLGRGVHHVRSGHQFDPEAVAFHARAAGAMREVLYAGAARKLQRL